MAPDPWGVASVADAPSGAQDPWGVASVDDAAPAPLSGPIGAAPVPAGLQGPPARGLASSPTEVLGTVGRHALNSVAGPLAAIAAPPQGRAETIANAAMPGGLAAYRTIVKPVIAPAQRAIQQVGQGDFSGAARSAESAIPVVGPWADQVESDTANKGAVAGLAGLATDVLAPKAVAKAVSAVPAAAETTARGIVKQTFGLRGKDFARDADPAGAYLRNSIGPNKSMASAADATDEARSQAGEALGNAYSQADARGTMIPADAVRNAIHPIIDAARSKAGGPGVVSDPATYQVLKDSFEPALQAADAKGGFTPSELWDIRKNMNESLNWGDQSRLNLTKTQQRVSGALGGVLEDAVPEVKDLNQNYQDLTKLHGRVAERAQGQPTLGQYAGRAAVGAVGSAAGHVLGGGVPGAGVAGGVLAQAVNSVPFKTGLASGLNVAGKVLRPAGRLASSTALPATLAGVANGYIPQKTDDAGENVIQGQSDDGLGENVQQDSPTEQSIQPETTPVPDAVGAQVAQNGNTGNGPAYDAGPLAGKPIPGMQQIGNIDVNHRPSITNADGSRSSIYSMTVPVNKDGGVWKGNWNSAPQYALVPSIANGKFMTTDGKIPAKGDEDANAALEQKATDYYDKTRQHLGIFDSADAAEKYASQTHAYSNDGTGKQVFAPSYSGEAASPKAATKPQALQKGAPVTLPDGSKGKVAHVIQGMGTVRVRTDDGRNLTVRAKALTVAPHIMVATHARRLPQ